jgi:hypothetical protein
MLHKYELVNHKGLKGVSFDGREILFADLTDEIAEQLEGKTHVLKKKTPAAAARALAVAAPATTEKVDK